jgi:hypothetical protein
MALATFVILVLALKRLYQGWTSLCIADTLVTKLKKERKDYIYRYIYIYIYAYVCVCMSRFSHLCLLILFDFYIRGEKMWFIFEACNCKPSQ